MSRAEQVLGRRAVRWVGLHIVHTCHPAALHDLRHREAIHWNLPQEALDDLLAWCRYIGGDGIGALQDAKSNPAHVCCFKRHSGSHHEVEQDAQSPDVCILTNISLSFKQLWGCIGQRAAERVQDITGRAECAETKVSHFNAVGAAVEDVLSL